MKTNHQILSFSSLNGIGIAVVINTFLSLPALCGTIRPIQFMSSRSPMWTLSARGIKKRPLFGWGFDGFGIAYPYIRNPQVTPIVVNLGEFT
jgi:O-antigen ligase